METNKPNVLLVICDQLRRDSVGINGGPVETPHLDQLAREGMTLKQAYSSYPMCTPARAALITGRMPHALKDDLKGRPYFFNDRILDTREVSIAKTFGTAGYDCGWVGKWHLHRERHIPAGPERMGFDATWTAVNAGISLIQPDNDDPGYDERVGQSTRWAPEVELEIAEEWMATREEGDKPFFLTLSWLPPHGPHAMPETHDGLLKEAAEQINELRPNIPERLHAIAREEWIQYHANVLGLDRLTGRLMDFLQNQGLEENTIVVFTSDHGDCLYSHGIKGKNQFYEEAAAIPFMARWPGHIPAGSSGDAFFSIIDIAPTLLGLCGIEAPGRMQGKDHSKYLRGIGPGLNTSAYMEVNHPWFDYRFGQGPQGNRRCIVTDDWKLVLMESKLGPGGAIPWQLFDRKEDPFELNNLANDPGYLPEISMLVHQMWEWMERTEDGDFHELTLNGLKEALEE